MGVNQTGAAYERIGFNMALYVREDGLVVLASGCTREGFQDLLVASCSGSYFSDMKRCAKMG